MASILVRFTSAPYSTSSASDGLDFALAATNYGHHVTVVFEGQAVWMWQANQRPPPGVKNMSKRLKSLPLFDIEDCYICQSSLNTYSVTPFSQAFQAADSNTLITLLKNADHVVTF